MAHDKLATIGRVAKPHGVKGELSVAFYADSPSLLDTVDRVFLRTPADDASPAPAARTRSGRTYRPKARPVPYTVRAWRMHRDRLLLTLETVLDRDQADALRGMELCVPSDTLPKDDPDDVLLHDLIGCAIHLQDGAQLGELRDIFTPTDEQEIWVIETPDGAEILFPATPEFVTDWDLEAKRIDIDPPEGLVELYVE